MTTSDIMPLVKQAKAKGINDPNMIASWIYNVHNGKKYYKIKQIKEIVLSDLALMSIWDKFNTETDNYIKTKIRAQR